MTDYVEKFGKLRVNTAGGTSPHKPCLLLAVIDLAEAGGLATNEIHYRPELIERFNDYFDVVRSERDRPNIYMPFFHLRGDGFWHLEPEEGRGAILESMNTAVKHRDITENVRVARLDDELHLLLLSAESRQELRAAIIARWFGGRSNDIWSVVHEHQPFNKAEVELREAVETNDLLVRDTETSARSAAFRRLVLQAYDYRCAASGWRIIMPDGSSLIEAAHIVPFSESYNDDPRNGIALTPTFHGALYRNLIAPGPEMKWHISPIFDKRIPDNRPFVELDGQPIIYSGDERYRPSKESLERRTAMLRTD